MRRVRYLLETWKGPLFVFRSDDVGRLQQRVLEPANTQTPETHWDYHYDGASRLVGINESTQPNGGGTATSVKDVVYGYDVDDVLVFEEHDDGIVARFAGIRLDTRPSGELLVKALPMVTIVEPGSTVDVRWSFLQYDGHALETSDSGSANGSGSFTATRESFERTSSPCPVRPSPGRVQ